MNTRQPAAPLARIAVICALVAAGLAGVAQAATANDPAFQSGLLWGLEKVRAPVAWDHSRGQRSIIAVVDSGIHLTHEDLKTKVVPGARCIDTGGDPAKCGGTPQDDDGHGTHVAGIAAAATNNGAGVAGIAPDARVMPIAIFRDRPCASRGTCYAATSSDVEAAIMYAADRGAHIINLSLGSELQAVVGPGFVDAINYAWDKGSIPVVAAGNEDFLPSGYRNEPAVVVTATDRNDKLASYSSSSLDNIRWAIAAPGGERGDTPESCATGGTPLGILSTYWFEDGSVNGYACLIGTSMAAPHVAGALAVLGDLKMQQTGKSSLNQAEWTSLIENYLLANAADVGASASFGSGRLDLGAAAAKLAADLGAPSATTTVPPTTVPPTPSTAPAPASEPGGAPSVPTTNGVPASAPTPPSSGGAASPESTVVPDAAGPDQGSNGGQPDGEPGDDDEQAAVAFDGESSANPLTEPASDDELPAPAVAMAIIALLGAIATTTMVGPRTYRALR